MISHVFVRDALAIPCRIVEADGSYYETWLGTGRHDCEGIIEYGKTRYLRLRNKEGELGVVEERELRYRCRRVYRRRTEPAAPSTDPPFLSNLRTITPEKRRQVRRQRGLPGTYLNTYEQLGSFEEWVIGYSIQQVAGGWIVHFEKAGDRYFVGPVDNATLIETVEDAGISREEFIRDLRKSGLNEVVDGFERS